MLPKTGWVAVPLSEKVQPPTLIYWNPPRQLKKTGDVRTKRSLRLVSHFCTVSHPQPLEKLLGSLLVHSNKCEGSWVDVSECIVQMSKSINFRLLVNHSGQKNHSDGGLRGRSDGAILWHSNLELQDL